MPQSEQVVTLEELEDQFPGWRLGSTPIETASGPGSSRYWASRNGVVVSALRVPDLAIEIQREEHEHVW